MLSALLLAACGSTPATSPTPDASLGDVTPADAPTRADDTPVAVDRVSPADGGTVTDVADASVSDVAAIDAVDASFSDVVAVDVVDAPTTDAADVSDAAALVDAPRRSFGEIYETILRPRCSECHGADRMGSAFIMRDAMSAYRALVDVPVVSRWIEVCGYTERFTNRMSYRVRPRDPAASLLYFLPECYVRDADHMRLTAEEREVIRAWIQRGAPETEF
ncbi:MAG: hypothetical protein U0325_09850 [Polyangiales bacterium]